MTDRAITYEQLVEMRPCYKGERLASLQAYAARHDRWTALDILRAKEWPAKDRLWLALRRQLIAEKTLHLLSADYAERQLLAEREREREPDPRSWEAVRIKRLWVRGEASDVALTAALTAADAASSASSAWAARAAAWAAASSASSASSAWAARAAAWADGAAEAESEWQVSHTIAVLTGEGV